MFHHSQCRMLKLYQSGFTLIELLVSISIISLLVAMLLPALTTARNAAKSVQCLSNLRQQALAFNLYTSHSKGYIPLNLDPRPAAPHFLWVSALTGEMLGYPGGMFWNFGWITANIDPASPIRKVFQCPAGNSEMFGGVSMAYNRLSGRLDAFGAPWPSANYRRKHMDDLKRPSETQMMIDGRNVSSLLGANHIASFEYNEGNGTANPGYPLHQFDTRHNDSSNVLYFDGHAGPLNAGVIATLPRRSMTFN